MSVVSLEEIQLLWEFFFVLIIQCLVLILTLYDILHILRFLHNKVNNLFSIFVCYKLSFNYDSDIIFERIKFWLRYLGSTGSSND